MTCVIGLIHGSRIYMGSDSAAVGNRFIRTTNLPKIFRNGPFLIGYCGSFRMGQVLEHSLRIPRQKEDQSDIAFMINVFIENVRNCLKEKGVASIEQRKETGGHFMVGYKGRLYSINSDFHVGDMLDGFDCIGSGAPIALGAMKALEKTRPKQRIEKSLEVAAYYSADVTGPFHVMSIRAD